MRRGGLVVTTHARRKSRFRIAVVAITTIMAATLPSAPTADAQDPSGERIVFVWGDTDFSKPDPDVRMMSMNRDGSDVRTIMDEDVGSWPDVSPDGTTIVYVFDGDLWLSDIDGGNRRRITDGQDGRSYRNPRFSPDGTRLVYRAATDATGGVFVSPADRPGAGRFVAEDGTDDRGERFRFGRPSWSPDGTRIAMSRNYSGPGVPDEEGGSSLAIVNDDASGLHEVPNTRIAHMGSGVSNTAWSPDGTEIAYLATTTAGADIVITAADGSTRRTILKYDAWFEDLAWSPDGSEILYTSYTHVEGSLDGPPNDIFAIAPDGSGKRLVLERPGAESYPTFAAPQAGGTAAVRSADRACPDGEVPDSGFTDIGSSGHRAAIDCAAWWEVTTGRTETTYAQEETVTRAQMASFIARAITESGGELPSPSRDHFEDDTGSVHEASINALAEAGIVAGVGDGRYAPSRSVARDQMARFLAQALEHRTGKLLPASADYFADDAGDTHENTINKTAEAGITGGNGSGYAPTDAVSRAQMASFLVRLLDVLVETSQASPPTG